jgi:hypothetical protein
MATVIVVASWLPYAALRMYWEYLLLTVPGASHNEFSGPALYFLPRLAIFAGLVTVGVMVLCAITVRQNSPTGEVR